MSYITFAHHLPGKYYHLYLNEKIIKATDEGGEMRGIDLCNVDYQSRSLGFNLLIIESG